MAGRRRSWPDPPGAIAYFCSSLPEPGPAPDRSHRGYPAARRDEVRRRAERFLERHVAKLWPAVVDGRGRFRWELLMDPAVVPAAGDPSAGVPPADGPEAFGTQFWTANVNPSDRYVLSVAGSLRYRISPLDNTYDNLTIAGDWTDNGHNEACVETAVMSGRLAAHAISGAPALEDIIGFDHP